MHPLTDENLADHLAQGRARVAQLQREHTALGEQLAAEAAQVEKLEAEVRRRRLAFAQTTAKSVDWGKALEVGPGMERHHATDSALESLGLYTMGYFPETLQRCVCLRVVRDRDTEVADLATSLEVLMPHVLPLPDGWCAIGVLEHAQAGRYYHLRFRPDGSQYQVVNLRLRSPDVEFTSDDLRTALTHIQRHHFFE
jgi:hypothetical protein